MTKPDSVRMILEEVRLSNLPKEGHYPLITKFTIDQALSQLKALLLAELPLKYKNQSENNIGGDVDYALGITDGYNQALTDVKARITKLCKE